jgi:hypothetical protein
MPDVLLTTDAPAHTALMHAPPAAEPAALAEFIADVLRLAHQAARAVHAPDQARGVLHVAQLFADELAKVHPRFDRARFIAAVIEAPA